MPTPLHKSALRSLGVTLLAATMATAVSAQQRPQTPDHHRSGAEPAGELRRPPRTGGRVVNGMAMVPAGKFYMGCMPSRDSECEDDESPGRNVHLDTFYIDLTEVTVDAYRKCVRAGHCTEPTDSGSECNWSYADRGQHPINCVDSQQAIKYCKYVRKRLPTEAEWEKAARGTDARTYPWGNHIPNRSSSPVANFADEARLKQFPSTHWSLTNYNDGHSPTSPVGIYPGGASPYGVHDMAGNVWEWVSDWYAEDTYSTGPTRNPKGPKNGDRYAIRGGSFGAALVYMRASSRDSDPPEQDGDHIGFRCARSSAP